MNKLSQDIWLQISKAGYNQANQPIVNHNTTRVTRKEALQTEILVWRNDQELKEARILICCWLSSCREKQ